MTKTILLTGATGYLGSYLAKALLSQGHKLIIFKRKNSSLKRIRSIVPKVALYNIEDLDYSVPFNAHGKIDAVIHTATCYGRHGEMPSKVFEANIGFPLRLMDAAKTTGVGVFINTDTILDKYLNSYSLSKRQLLEWGRFLCDNNKMFFVNMRLEHFYGPGDEDSKFTTHVINSCLRNVPELNLTLGEQRRDFIYIDDVISAYLIVLDKSLGFPNFFNDFQVGSGAAVSIRDFVEKVHHLCESKTQLVFGSVPYRNGEMMSSRANVEALIKLGWSCKINLEQGLELIMKSYKQ